MVAEFAQLQVADVMTLDPIVVRSDQPVEAAQRLLATYRVSGLPVVEANGSLVGVISRTDLTESVSPTVSALVRGLPSGLRVGEVMTSPAVTVPMTATLAEAARVMRDEHIHRVVALDDAGHPIGVLTASDYVNVAAEA
jgi:CBS-domain-containing membrane protein